MQDNFTLGGFEKRKAALTPVLTDAAREGILTLDAAGRLATYLASRGVDVGGTVNDVVGVENGLDTPLAAEPFTATEESEAPRFVRGFHDILITIGLVAGLSGLWGIGSVFLVLPAVILLAEVLVRRQHLALPAFVLTIFFAAAAGFAALPFLDFAGSSAEQMDGWTLVWLNGSIGLALGGFYWRYRVPIALAALIFSGFALLVLIVATLASQALSDPDLVETYPFLVPVFLGSFAFLLFVTALRLDLNDPNRRTRRSDVAFWLHLMAAPSLLYTVISIIFLDTPNQWFGDGTSIGEAIGVIAAIVALMITGIVLDRRAFVTSGLISLGYAFYILFSKGRLETILQSTDGILFAILLMVGIVVLSLGIGWQVLRRYIITLLPPAVQAKLPPVRI